MFENPQKYLNFSSELAMYDFLTIFKHSVSCSTLEYIQQLPVDNLHFHAPLAT